MVSPDYVMFHETWRFATKITSIFILSTDKNTDIQEANPLWKWFEADIFLMNSFWLVSGFVNMQLLLILGHFSS